MNSNLNPQKKSQLTRRSFLGASSTTLAALAAGGLANVSQTASAADAKPMVSGSFPGDFWWGSATAAYQVEGATTDDGRGASIWDTFSHAPGKTSGGDTGDVACDQYHRYPEDIKLMAEQGIKHYRFSISWPRILPTGRGEVNEKGVDYYKRLVDALHQNNITPHATLYHWDLPQALQDRYAGWQSREVVKDFGDYTTATVKRLGDRITHWMTLNEINSFAMLGYGFGKPPVHAPGIALQTAKERWQVVHHALLAHGTACLAIRAASPGRCHVAIAEDYQSFVPLVETPDNIAAAGRAFTRSNRNRAILMPILTGHYDASWLEDLREGAPDIADGDLKLIGQPLDALGFNCYSGAYVRAADNPEGYEVLPMFGGYPKGNMPWLNILPEAIYWGIRLVGEAAGKKSLPIFISENGCADGASPGPGELVCDTDRIMYYRAYLRQVQRAVAEGYPVVGYFPWSLLDNFEWAYGYSKRFGMIRVDVQTQKRTPKLSYHWYQEVIRQGRVL